MATCRHGEKCIQRDRNSRRCLREGGVCDREKNMAVMRVLRYTEEVFVSDDHNGRHRRGRGDM